MECKRCGECEEYGCICTVETKSRYDDAKRRGAIEALDELKSRLFGVEDVLEASDFVETWKDSKEGLYALFLLDELKDEIEREK